MAATPQIAVQITGKSDLQKIFGQTNSQLKAFQAQNEKVSAQIKSMTTIGKSGFAAVDKSVVSLVRNTFDLYRNVSRVLDPLRAIAGGATLAGLVAVEAKFAALGATALKSGRALNMSVARQQIWGGAAVLANYSAQTAIAGISATEISSTEARLGQNRDAAKRWSIIFGGSSAWMKASDEQLMMQESKYLARLNGPAKAAAEAHLEGDLGQSADYVGFLSQGPATIQKQLNQSASDGAMTKHQAEVLAALNYQINNVGLSLKGLGISIATAVGPDITKALGGLTDWMNKNRGSIATDFQKMFGDIEKHVRPAIDDINKVVQAIGGWRPVLEGTIGVLTASAVVGIAAPFVRLGAAIAGLSGGGAGSFGALGVAMRSIGFGFVGGEIVNLGVTDATGSSDAGRIAGDATSGAIWGGKMFGLPGAGIGGVLGAAYGGYEAHAASKAAQAARADSMVAYYRSQGLSAVQAAALVGGFQQESGLDPTASNSVGGGHFGIGQWGLARQADFAKLFGHDLAHSTLQEQMKFSLDEMFNGKEGSAGRALLAAKTADAATTAALSYERPAAPGTPAWQNEYGWRLANTSDILGRDGPQYLPKIDDAGNAGQFPTDNEPQRLLGMAQPGTGMGSEDRRAVTITVVPPANHKVIARSAGGPIQVKTSRVMPSAGRN
jgi:hypothetical protein